jgi:ketosteroid isomerase-like protein
MSEENVELARRGMRSAEEFVGLLDDYVVRDNREYPLIDVPDVEMGREQLEEFLRHYWGTFEDYSLDATELIDAGQSVVVVLHEQARGRGSGAALERDWAHVWTFRKGRIIRMEAFRTREEALEAAGLRE